MPRMGNNSIQVENLAGSLEVGKIFFFILLFCSCSSQADDYFVTENFISIGQNPVRNSDPLSLLSCGHKVYVEQLNQDWSLIKAGPYKGYIKKNFLNKEKPICFQDRFPKFFEEFNIKLTEMLYWSQLNDQYFEGKTK